MSWDDLRAVASEGVEVGCHTETHAILSQIAQPSELDREIRGAKEKLEQRLGMPVAHFSYPTARKRILATWSWSVYERLVSQPR